MSRCTFISISSLSRSRSLCSLDSSRVTVECQVIAFSMASRRVSISALLCEDDPPATSPPRVPAHSPDSARQQHHRLDLYREPYPPHPPQPAPPRRTPSPDLSRSSLRTWPPPSLTSRAYNPSQAMFPAVQTTSPQLRTGHSHQSQQPPYLPPSPPRPSYSQSPYSTTCLSSDSPASTVSLPRPSSIHSPSSPLLYTQRLAPSPGGYYHSPPSSGASQYDPSLQPIVSPTLRHARHSNQTEPIASSSARHASLSRISTTSSSSFPQALLNPVSPQQSPLGGLEALVQAATVERDRLEAKASLDRNPDASRSTVRRSPELLFRSSHLQAPAPRSPVTPSLISRPRRDSYSESSLRIGPGPETHPSKRQRQSHPYSGSDHSWDPSSQFSGLMGPGITPRGQSSDVRTEIRPTHPIPSRDKEGASPTTSRVSPTRERSARKQHVTEDKSFRSHGPGYREPVTYAPQEGWRVLAAEEPRSMARQDVRSHVDSHPPMPKVSRSVMALEKQDTPPSSPPPQAFFIPSKPAPPAAPPPPRGREDVSSPQAHPLSPNDTLPSATTASQTFVGMENVPTSEKLMESFVPRAPTPEESSMLQVESLPPNSVTTAVQDTSVNVVSPPALNTRDVGAAELIKLPSPVLPSRDEAETTLAAPGIQSSPAIIRVSLPPHEIVLNPPSSEQETCLPPTTASPSPRVPSPTVWDVQDGIHANQPTGEQISAVAGTGTVTLVAESQDQVETSLTSSGEPETTTSPFAVPLAAEAIPLAVSDSPHRTESRLIPIINEVKSEPAPELGITVESKQGHVVEQGQAEMDVDEELLSLVADDLPSRSSQTMLRKQGPSSPEDKHTVSFHAPLKQESVIGTITLPCPSPAPSPFAMSLDGVSKLSPDTAVSVRDPETSMLKTEERPAQKKKVIQSLLTFCSTTDPHKTKQHAQPKSRAKPSGSAKTKLKVPFDGPSTAPQKSKKSSATVMKRSAVAARSRSTSVMPVSTTPAPGALPSVPGEAEPEEAEEEMEDKLYCVCKTRYDDERIMIACDRCVAVNRCVAICSYTFGLHSCDEWYHTSCVNMPDLEVDLVDQFICPVCVESAYLR